jgi:dihydrodipicolinate synthase/N-acetylneuraminate lyase
MNTLLPSLEIDLAASQLFQAALIRDGVHGLVLMGTVGEGNSLSAQESIACSPGLLAGHHAI